MEIKIKAKHDTIVKNLIKEEMSKKYYRYVKRGNAKYFINEKLALSHEDVKAGQCLTIIFDEEFNKEELLYDIPLDIIFINENYLIVNKPSGLNTIPSKGNPGISLYNAIYTYLKKNDILKTIHIITRLDNPTSGLVLVALNKEAALYFNSNHSLISKKYLAVCDGYLDNDHFFIEKPISKDDEGIKRKIDPSGKHALTEVFKLNTCKGNTLIRVRLHTGRTHQIRLHMSSISHPLLGDSLYGNDSNLLHLHAYKLTFIDNLGVKREFENLPIWYKNYVKE